MMVMYVYLLVLYIIMSYKFSIFFSFFFKIYSELLFAIRFYFWSLLIYVISFCDQIMIYDHNLSSCNFVVNFKSWESWVFQEGKLYGCE